VFEWFYWLSKADYVAYYTLAYNSSTTEIVVMKDEYLDSLHYTIGCFKVRSDKCLYYVLNFRNKFIHCIRSNFKKSSSIYCVM
jgi:hypothetical protein